MAGATSTLRAATRSGRIASQDAAELAAFIALLQAENVRSYGEIGAREGDTFNDVMRALPKHSRGVALDLPGGPWGHRSTRLGLCATVESLTADGWPCSALFGDSMSTATQKLFIGRGPFDAVLIDANHTFDAVHSDWLMARKSAKLIAFHDIDGRGQMSGAGEPVEVPILWGMIRDSGLRTQEIITPGSNMGIGVVWVK